MCGLDDLIINLTLGPIRIITSVLSQMGRCYYLVPFQDVASLLKLRSMFYQYRILPPSSSLGSRHKFILKMPVLPAPMCTSLHL